MKMYLIPVIVGVVLALFADDIDRALNGNRELKKVIVVFACGVIAVCIIMAAASVLV